MLTLQHRQELISRAYVAAVAASVGMNSSTCDLDYGIDLTLHQVTSRTSLQTGKTRIVESGLTLDIQIKCTINAITEADCIAYDLDTNCYDDLRDNLVQTPRILVLHVQPSEESERIQHTQEALKIGGCCYWQSLRGAPSTDNTSKVRIRIPIQQEFSPKQEPKLLLWRLVDWAGIVLKDPTPSKLDEIYQLAVSSGVESLALFDWLIANEVGDSTDRTNELKAFRRSIDSTDQ